MLEAFLPFRSVESDTGFEKQFCIDAVHITFWSLYARRHGGSTGWKVDGSCDGTCLEQLVIIHHCALDLVDIFKAKGVCEERVLHAEPSDEELERRHSGSVAN